MTKKMHPKAEQEMDTQVRRALALAVIVILVLFIAAALIGAFVVSLSHPT